jgi:ferrous iron transport protein B
MESGRSLLKFGDELKDYTDEVQKISRANSAYGAFQVLCNYGQISYFHKNQTQRDALEQYFKTIEYAPMKWQMWETLERHKIVKEISARIIQDAGQPRSLTDHTDAILLHPLWGVLFFVGIMTLMFQSVFSWASLPMEWIEYSFSTLITYLQQILPSGFFTDLLLNGILAGLSGVIVFVPQIAFLFLFISLLEDSGYMARVSFLLDYFMRRFGLSGRSVIPLIGGFACAIPAIMATRSISNQKDRLITMLITPLMSCSARLPVYTLLIALVIPSSMRFMGLSAQGVTLAALYFLGILAGLALAFILSKSMKAKEEGFFMLELPTYKWPDPRNTITNIFEKVRIFLWDAGKIIVAISILLWLLSSYGPGSSAEYLTEKYSTSQEDEVDPELRDAFMADKLEHSYAGILGRAIEPAIAPLGYDWKIGIAIITSFAAREVFVGTLATIFSVSDPEDARSIREKMSEEKDSLTGMKKYDLPMGLSLMIFYAFALQCMSTIAIMKRESGGWKWPAIQFVLMGAMAYLGALLTYQMLI